MDKTNEMFTKTLDVLSANTHLIEILTIIIVISTLVAILIYVALQQAAKQGNCTTIKDLYPIPTNIKSVLANKDQMKYTISDTDYDTRLRDVYVKVFIHFLNGRVGKSRPARSPQNWLAAQVNQLA